MAPPQLQFAFQGGGAKFVAMLPVAAAISDFSRDRKIAVSAVAGTSAGAICAALIAAECDFNGLVNFLRTDGKTHLAALIRGVPDLTPLSRFKSGGLWQLYQFRHTLLELVPKLSEWITQGRSVLDRDAFERFIDEVFSYCQNTDVDIRRFHDPKLFITVTDIVSQRGKIITKGNLKQTVISSCSIPIALRSFDFLPESPLVDGGLCNNLPIGPLMKDQKTPIFAVFPVEKTQRAPIRSLYSYFMAGIFSPMEHNVAEAKELISEEFHIPIDVSFSTFDFDKAIQFLSDGQRYSEIYDNTCRRLNNLINLYGNVYDRTQIRFTDTIVTRDYMEALRNITDNYENGFKPRKGTMIVSVNSDQILSKRVEDRPFDSILIKSEFEVLSNEFSYYRTGRMLFDGRKIPQVWWARNITQGTTVSIRALALDPINPGDESYCLIEFLGPRHNFKKGDIIELNCAYNLKHAMELLNMGQPDYFTLTNPHTNPFDDIEMILRYPKKIGILKLQIKSPEKNDDRLAALEGTYFNPSELDFNFSAIGVKTKALGGRKSARVDILPLPRTE